MHTHARRNYRGKDVLTESHQILDEQKLDILIFKSLLNCSLVTSIVREIVDRVCIKG